MDQPKKTVAVPVVSGPVVSQAMPAPADPDAVTVLTSPDAPIALSQISSAGWSETIPPRLSRRQLKESLIGVKSAGGP